MNPIDITASLITAAIETAHEAGGLNKQPDRREMTTANVFKTMNATAVKRLYTLLLFRRCAALRPFLYI
jgi:hypothetical protein